MSLHGEPSRAEVFQRISNLFVSLKPMRCLHGLARVGDRYAQIWWRAADCESGPEFRLPLYRHAYARVMTSFRSRIGGILFL